jgi:hypothetical protein
VKIIIIKLLDYYEVQFENKDPLRLVEYYVPEVFHVNRARMISRGDTAFTFVVNVAEINFLN